jgi:WD40 repeat protein
VPLWFVSPASAAEPTYWDDVRPILRRHCIVCHSTKNLKEVEVSAGLALDSYEATMKGAKRPVIVPGKSKESLLYQLLVTEDLDKQMPKDALPLDKEKIDLIARWIDAGAKEGTKPDTVVVTPPTGTKRTRSLDVVLATNFSPPPGVLSPAKPGKLELVLKAGPLAPVTAVTFSPDGRLLASGVYGRVTVWDMTTGRPVKILTNVLGAVNDLRFSPDGKLLAVAGGQPSFRGDLRLYSTADWQLRAALGGHEDVVFAVAFSPDSRRLASASFDKTVRIWDVAAHKPQLTIPDHSDFVYGVAFSPNGKWLVSCSKDRSVKVFDATTGKSTLTFSGMNEDVLAVAVRPDGKAVVSSGYEAGLHWWNPETAQRVRVQAGHSVAVHELAFSTDGKLLASAGADGTVRLWNGTSGAPLKTFTVGTVNYAVALSPDGKQLATGSFDGLVRLWDVDSGRHLVTLLSLPSDDPQPLWLLLTPEGYIAAADALRTAAQWRLGGQAVAADPVWRSLHQPETVLKAFRGEALPPPKVEK